MSNTPISKLLAERNGQYKDAWKLTGLAAQPLADQIFRLLITYPELWYNWIIILNKLIRILGSPEHLDSWKDIIGYATLAADYLEGKEDDDVAEGVDRTSPSHQ